MDDVRIIGLDRLEQSVRNFDGAVERFTRSVDQMTAAMQEFAAAIDRMPTFPEVDNETSSG